MRKTRVHNAAVKRALQGRVVFAESMGRAGGYCLATYGAFWTDAYRVDDRKVYPHATRDVCVWLRCFPGFPPAQHLARAAVVARALDRCGASPWVTRVFIRRYVRVEW